MAVEFQSLIRQKNWNLKTPWTVVAILLVLVALLDPTNFGRVASFATGAFFGTLPYIAFAVLLIAYLKAAGAEASIAASFQGKETRMIIMAALFGGLAPFCSCEVIPFIAGLLALGAPLSAVMAFWLSSPLIDPPTLLITAAALGWPYAIGKALFAVLLGLAGGFAIKGLYGGQYQQDAYLKKVEKSCCGCGPSPFSGRPVWKIWNEEERVGTFKTEFAANALFLIKWLVLAYVLEALLVSYVPADMIARLVGGEGLLPIITAALIGMPAYLNSYVAPPMLAGLVEQGMSSGAAMAFMIAGAVSSIPAMAAVWALVKPKVFFSYLALGVTGAVVSGFAFSLVIN